MLLRNQLRPYGGVGQVEQPLVLLREDLEIVIPDEGGRILFVLLVLHETLVEGRGVVGGGRGEDDHAGRGFVLALFLLGSLRQGDVAGATDLQ